MPAFKAEVPHGLGQQAARERMESFLQKIAEKYKGQIGDLTGAGMTTCWNLRFRPLASRSRGTLAVQEDKVVMNGELPFSAMMFKGKIVGGIQEALEKALA